MPRSQLPTASGVRRKLVEVPEGHQEGILYRVLSLWATAQDVQRYGEKRSAVALEQEAEACGVPVLCRPDEFHVA